MKRLLLPCLGNAMLWLWFCQYAILGAQAASEPLKTGDTFDLNGRTVSVRKLETGELLWKTFAPTSGKSERWGHAFAIKYGERSFIFCEKGDLIIAKLTPEKYEELGRARLIEPDNRDPGRHVVWSHPAFANKSIYARNDKTRKSSACHWR